MPRIRTRLLLYFLAFSFLCLGGIVALSWMTHRQQAKAIDLSSDLKSLQQELHENALLTKSFFLHDAQSVPFHRTGQSGSLDHKRRSDRALDQAIDVLVRTQPLLSSADSSKLRGMQRDQRIHAEVLDRIVCLLMQRGMEDYGLEGAMRLNAHALESSASVSLVDVLSLRRLEKDYIIRHQEKYVDRLNERIALLLKQVARADAGTTGSDSTLRSLTNYRDAFNLIVDLDRRIGVRNHIGDFARLGQLENELNARLDALLASNGSQFERSEKELFLGYLISVGAFLLLSVLSAFLISRRIAGPIKELAASVQQFVQSDFRQLPPTANIRARDVEMVELANHFQRLQEEIHGQIDRLNERVRERTLELQTEKELVQYKNSEITASLRYARGIQESMLNSSRNIAELLPDSFLLNAPRDIVGGDFIWTHSQEVNGTRCIYFAVADCTGHGVPASLMSVMFHHAMNEVVKDMRLPSPARILERVNENCAMFFGTDHGIRLGDGMSISLCMYDPDALILTFAGSFQSIFVLNEGELVRIKGDRIHIGAGLKELNNKRFSDHRMQLADGAMIYLFSDGFVDQFGGEAGRKLNAGNFKKLLAQAQSIPIAHQHKYFQDAFRSWKGPHDQVDDVMLLGVRAARTAQLPLAHQAA